MAGVAVNPENGHVFTGNGADRSLSEVDPVAMKELRSVDVAGPVDAIAFDSSLQRIYADEDDGTRIFVIDAKTFKQIGTIALPGHKPEYLAIDPKTHELYQNIANLSEVVVVDPKSLRVSRVIKTPEVTSNHPLQFDSIFDQVLVGGANGKLSVYSSSGSLQHTIVVPEHIDQCSLDEQRHLLACAGSGKITLIKNDPKTGPAIVGQIDVARGMHTLAIDPKTGDIFAVWATQSGDLIQRFTIKP
ncbi:MAG: hypothetical protein M3Y21_12270, partial [Candidatus Eremiobacteraeota bacterium]|nr:hypothetical protein [Candidatus Eremiobacteraeota bacterium]